MMDIFGLEARTCLGETFEGNEFMYILRSLHEAKTKRELTLTICTSKTFYGVFIFFFEEHVSTICEEHVSSLEREWRKIFFSAFQTLTLIYS